MIEAYLGIGGVIAGLLFCLYLIFKILEPIFLKLSEFKAINNFVFKPILILFQIVFTPIFYLGYFLFSYLPEKLIDLWELYMEIIYFIIKFPFKFFKRTNKSEIESTKNDFEVPNGFKSWEEYYKEKYNNAE